MDEVTDEVVLDTAATPGGEYELLAYRAKGTTWIGYRPKGWPSEAKGSAVQGSIGLHTGSREHALEVTASLYGTWGLAFGGVAPEIERVAVRNERGEVFPAKIIPLPGSYREPFRAAWGVATGCHDECELIGYDARGRSVGQTMILPDHEPAPEETLELIRAHCDDGLRYMTWALRRMPSIPEQSGHVQQVRNAQHALAIVLAYVEGATDERTALSATEEIVRRYEAAVETEGWQPSFGGCSFCGDRPVVAWFEGPDFTNAVTRAEDVRADEAWLACSTCYQLVEAEDRGALVARSVERRSSGRRQPPNPVFVQSLVASVREAHERFWVRRGST